MYYTEMRPDQVRDAVRRNVPAVMAAGCIEYHGPHLPVGTDYLIAETIIRRVEQCCECVVMPPLPFSSTMFWAAGPEDGEVDFDPEALRIYAREVLRGLVKVGFQRIYILQHHQGDNGLPALALKMAAAEVIRDCTLSWGSAWGRLPDLPDPGIFGKIRIAHLDSFSHYPADDPERCPVGHGGMGETQLIMADYNRLVDLSRLAALKQNPGNLPEWLSDAHLATQEQGRKWIDFCVRGWAEELSRCVVPQGTDGT